MRAKPQKRVAMLILNYYPLVGGAEQQLASIAPLLQARGVDVQVLTRRYGDLVVFENVQGIPVYRLPAYGPKAIASICFTIAALVKLYQLRPDVIHAYSLFSPTTIAVLAHRIFGTPVVVKLLRGGHRGDIERMNSKTLGLFRLWLFGQTVAAFLTISQEITTELQAAHIPTERCIFLPNGVDIDRFQPTLLADRPSRRTDLGLAAGPTAVFTGRFVPEKQLAHLVDCWPTIRALIPDAQLVLVGDGPEKPNLQHQAGPGIRFVGPVDDVAPYLQAADVFVLPSRTEGLSNALLEAMASGLAVVTTAVGGNIDLVEQGQRGWLIEPDDQKSLCWALIALLSNPQLCAYFGQQARSHVVQHYALPVIADQLRDIYDRL